ncbi:hypothetical protein Maes01_00610 [Microbulbifer aestuariivivens]|uniref:GP-PDE domain-containing protein n=1 Tax=Microbulbifer aestuariivivens TaxID=1908308 RepID=A0ABP9WLI8_9GAMM
MLIAHRGDTSRQPENTIAAFEDAHSLGACAIQAQVQFSAEGTPWCFAPPNLRLPGTRRAKPLHRISDRDLRQLPLNTLAQLLDWAGRHRHLDWFIELQDKTLQSVGTEQAVEAVARRLLHQRDSFAVMTRDCRSLRLARSIGCHQVALKLDSVAKCLTIDVLTLAPDYLLIRDRNVDCDELPPGPWQWVVYEVNSAEEAIAWRARGAHHILTGNLPLLMRSREASDVYGF